MTRVAIYARYSDDTQNPRSCGDQIALLREHAEARGWAVVATYQDDAISGFAMANRPAINAVVAAAGRREFDVLLAEDESRISRNLGHLATLRDELIANRARLATLASDNVDLMHIAFKGGFAQQYLVDLGQKTARGMRANAERGLATGSRLYGYKTAPGGETAIVADEAEIVRRVCTLFADYRMSGREIADALNRDRIPGPRGKYWNASTLLGSRERGNGILRSEIYAGVKVWNRTEVTKDPRTGKRQPTTRPPEQWKRTDVEALRIVPQDLWDRVQARLTASAKVRLSEHGNRRKPGVFSGLLKCGVCGSSYTSYRRGQLVCAGHREKGPSVCSNSKIVDRGQVEARALEGLQTRMLTPAAAVAYVKLYHDAWARIDRERRDRRRPLERRLGELSRGIERLLDAIVDGSAPAAMGARVAAMEAEQAQVAAELAAEAPAEGAITLHPGAPAAYAKLCAELRDSLTAFAEDPEAAALNRPLIDKVRGLIDRIEIVPNPRGRGGIDLRLHGNMNLLLTPDAEPQAWRAPSRFATGSPLVAGGGYKRAPSFAPVVFTVEFEREAA